MPSAGFADLERNTISSPYPPEMRFSIEEELTRICSDESFRSSRRNCEFLRFVVQTALDGRAEEIKERTIGVEIFNRLPDYDTGSDAVVRVRANDVRKRLTAFYEQDVTGSPWKIMLQARSYVPVFQPAMVEPEIFRADVPAAHPDALASPPAKVEPPLLSLRALVMPTIVALFLCAITFRWQIFNSSPFLDFWDTFLNEKSSVALVFDANKLDPATIALSDLNTAGSLLATLSSFNVRSEERTSMTGELSLQAPVIHITHNVEHCERSENASPGEAACIIIQPASQGRSPELWIAGASNSDLREAVRAISSRDGFPQAFQIAMHRRQPSRLKIRDDQPAGAKAVIATR